MRNSKVVQGKNNIFFAVLLIVLGTLFRTVWHFGPNVEFVTAATLLSASYLGRKWAIIVPLIIMIITDALIGNTNIFIFTWSAYAIIGAGGHYIQKFKVQSSKFKVIRATSLGIIASFWFYLWTNFGVWLLDSWGMYPRTLTGLVDAYLFGLPFLKFNLLGNLIFVPLAFIIVEMCKSPNPIFFIILKKLKKIPRYEFS